MKEILLKDVLSFFDSIKCSYFLFASENIQDPSLLKNVTLVSKYKSAIVIPSDGILCFKDGDNTLCFRDVRCIQIDEENSVGIAFDVVCGGGRSKNNSSVYTIIAD